MFYKTLLEKFLRYKAYVIVFICLLLFTLITDFNGLYGQDSYEYLRYTNSLKQFLITGAHPGDFFWPLFYPISGAVLSFIFKPVFALQLVSMVSYIGASIYLKKIIAIIYNTPEKITDAFIFLFFIFSPYMLRASLVVMSDTLCLFFLTAAWYYFVKYRKTLNNLHFVLFLAFSVASVETRYGAVVLLVIPGFIAAFTFLKNFKWKVLAISIILTGILITPHLLVRLHHPVSFINNDWLKEWSLTNFFKNSFVTVDAGSSTYTSWNIIYVFYNFFHPAFCFAGILLFAFSIICFKKQKNKEVAIMGVSVFLYALFLAGIPFQNLRFLQLSFSLVAIVLFPGFIYGCDYLNGKGTSRSIMLILLALVITVQLGLFYRVFVPFYHDNKTEKQIATAMLKYPGPPVYTFSVDGALRAYGVNNRLISLYIMRLDSATLLKGEKLILFNEMQFSKDYEGQNVMNNFNYLKKNLILTKVEDLPDNWCLWKAY